MAKGKRLNTTVHLSDFETGEAKVLGPNDKLSAEDRKELEKRWGKKASEFLEDSEDEEPEALSAEEHEEAGHPLADSAPADDTSPQVEEAMERREEARTEANPEGVDDSGSGKARRR